MLCQYAMIVNMNNVKNVLNEMTNVRAFEITECTFDLDNGTIV